MHQLVILDLVSDLSIGLACVAIAAALIHFARRPVDLPYSRVFVAFALFVVADGVLVDGEGAIRLANERAERLFGYARGELVGRPSSLVLP